MPVVIVHEGISQEQYEESVRKLTGKDRMESTADWPVPGVLVHAAGPGGPNGFRVVDVWESQEAADAFAAELIPMLAELGVQSQPEMYPAHTFISA